jgi:hypothetical protein
MALFDRAYQVVIETAGENAERIEIDGLRVEFKIKKTSTTDANTLILNIYNLSLDTRSKIQDNDALIIFKAGYTQESGPQVLFIGQITDVIQEFQPPEIITSIEAIDGNVTLREVRFSESFAATTLAIDIVNTLVRVSELGVKEIRLGVNKSFDNGLTVSGPIKKSFIKLAESTNSEFSIIDNEIQIIPKGDFSSVNAVFLSPETGLISRPSPITQDSNQLSGIANNLPAFNVTSLLNPRINPGAPIQLESQDYKGIFRVEDVEYFGDTHGEHWVVNAEIQEVQT